MEVLIQESKNLNSNFYFFLTLSKFYNLSKQLESQGITFPKSLRKPLFESNNDMGPGDYDLRSTLFDHQQWLSLIHI